MAPDAQRSESTVDNVRHDMEYIPTTRDEGDHGSMSTIANSRNLCGRSPIIALLPVLDLVLAVETSPPQRREKSLTGE